MIGIITFILEIIGTVAFAVSGALVAIEKKMDMLGIIILGVTTAVGGGIVRDLILGITPPQSFVHPLYVGIAAGVSLITFIPWIRGLFGRKKGLFDVMLLIMDSLGLGIFTVVGISVAKQFGSGIFLTVFVGVVTGVGGGVMRDIMSGNTPTIFVKHFYCSASVIGALAAYFTWRYAGAVIGMIAGTVLIFTLRLLAARFRWKLPKA